MRTAALALAVIMSGCTVDRAEAPAAPDTTAATPSPVAPAGPPAAGAYIARGACPFECCMYREWTLETPAVVRAAPATDAPDLFSLDAGVTVTADSGNVHVIRPGIVVADRPFAIAETPGAPVVAAGDTVHVLDTIGEGYVHTRYQGQVFETNGQAWLWGQEPAEYHTSPRLARLVSEGETQWWVHVTLADGRAGWVMMDDIRVDGADACA